MKNHEVKANGATVFWDTSSVSRSAMVAAFAAVFGEDSAALRVQPEDTNFRALKRAVERRFRNGRGRARELLVRASETAITVVREKVGGTANEYETLHSFPVPIANEDGTGWSVPPSDEIRDDFLREKGILDAVLVGKAITNFVERDLQGTRIRSAGGIYWVPEAHLPQILRFAEVIEARSAVRLNLLTTVADGALVRTIHRALDEEAAALNAEIRAWLLDPENKGRKFPRRFVSAADEMKQRAASYSGELGAALEVTRDLEKTIGGNLVARSQFAASASSVMGAL